SPANVPVTTGPAWITPAKPLIDHRDVTVHDAEASIDVPKSVLPFEARPTYPKFPPLESVAPLPAYQRSAADASHRRCTSSRTFTPVAGRAITCANRSRRFMVL